MRMPGRFRQTEYRRETGICVCENLIPLIPGFCQEYFLEPVGKFRPPIPVVLLIAQARIGYFKLIQQFLVKPLFYGANDYVLFIFGLIRIDEMGAAVKYVTASLFFPDPGSEQSVKGGHHGSRAIDHRRIHNLSLA